MKEIEDYVKPRREQKGACKDGEEVYDMCD